MVCHICNMPASAKCHICERFVCARHYHNYTDNPYPYNYHVNIGSSGCTSCLNRRREAYESDGLIKEEIKQQRLWCDFCQRSCGENEATKCASTDSDGYKEEAHNLSCSICGKKYCKKHGQVLTTRRWVRDRDGRMWTCDTRWNEWHRCINHLKIPNITGVHILSGFFEVLFMGKPDKKCSQ